MLEIYTLAKQPFNSQEGYCITYQVLPFASRFRKPQEAQMKAAGTSTET
jgi:hypothetical protein